MFELGAEHFALCQQNCNSDEFLKNEINPSNSGRWTLNEHTIFLEALDKYGVNWKKIDSLIKT